MNTTQWLLVPLSGKSVDELFEIWEGQEIRNWERMSLQIMLYPNIIRPFAYFFMCKGQAEGINKFARKFEDLSDVTEGKVGLNWVGGKNIKPSTCVELQLRDQESTYFIQITRTRYSGRCTET